MKNHKILILILVLGVTLSQDIAEIDYFYNSGISQPFITFDVVNNTSYYLNEYNPELLTDFKILDININGSSLAPMGTYHLNNFYQQFISDTLSSNSFEHNRGDYAYYENSIFISNKNNNTSTFLMGQGRSQPVYNISDSQVETGNTLQNYFVNLNKFYHYNDDSEFYFSTSAMYHKEDINIPGNFQDSSYYSRFSDSYMYGLTADLNLDKFSLNFSNSSQLLRGNHYHHLMLDEYTNWLDFGLEANYNEYISVLLSFNTKTNTIEGADIFNENNLYNGFLTGKLNYGNSMIKVLFGSIGSSRKSFDTPIFNFHLSYHFEKINLICSIDKKTESFINRGLIPSANINDSYPINIFDIYSVNFQYKNKFSTFIFEPYLLTNYYNDYFDDPNEDNVYEYTETEIRGLKSLVSFKNDYLISNINIGIYSSDNSEIDDNQIPLNSYSNYSILFSPKINKKRFRPFIGVSGSYMDLNPAVIIDPYYGEQDFSQILSATFDRKKVNLFTFEIGLIIKGFKLTYSIVNPLNEEVSFTFDQSHDLIRTFSNLKINWQFLD